MTDSHFDKPMRFKRCARVWVEGHGYQAFCEVEDCGKPVDGYCYDLTCGPVGDFLFACDDPAHIAFVQAEGARMDREREARDEARRASTPRSAREEYAKKNPLGGPATVFLAIAERLKAGEEYHAVLADYDLVQRSASVPQVDRGEAVNLVYDLREYGDNALDKITMHGLRCLFDAIERMDAALRKPPSHELHTHGEGPCPDGDACPDARRYGSIHPAPSSTGTPDDDLPGMLAVAKGVSEQTFPHTMDAAVWAAEYVKLNPGADEGTMIGWFANAIMAGYDTATARSATGTMEALHDLAVCCYQYDSAKPASVSNYRDALQTAYDLAVPYLAKCQHGYRRKNCGLCATADGGNQKP